MTNNEEQFTQEDERQETLGPLLKAARESKGMTVQDIADRLHLRPSIVNDIESDCFSDIASSTYVRGYVKNFTRIVEAPEDRIMACLAKQVPAVTEPPMQSFSRKTTRQARDNRLMWVTYLIVAVLVTLLVVWWVQKSELLSGTDFSKPTVEEIAESQAEEQLSNTNDAGNGQLILIEESILETPIDKIDEIDDPNLKVLALATTDPSSVTVDSVFKALKPLMSDIETQDSANPAADNVEPDNATDGTTALEVSLSGDCWIKATDSTGKVLINDLKKSGQTILVSGVAPFKLVLGAPQVVAIKLNDQPLDMSKFPRNKVARITIPLVE